MTKKKEQESTSSSSKKSLTAKHSCKHQPRRQDSSSSSEQEEEDEEDSDDESSSSDEEYPRAVLYHYPRLPSMYMSSMSLGTKLSLEGVRWGWRRGQRKRASQGIKLSPPSTSPRKVVKAQVPRKIPRDPPPIALGGHHHHPFVLWH